MVGRHADEAGSVQGVGAGGVDLQAALEAGEAARLAAIARAYGAEGIKISCADELLPALQRAIELKRPVVIDVYMKNIPTPTAGHWNIMDIYSPGKKVHHVATGE